MSRYFPAIALLLALINPRPAAGQGTANPTDNATQQPGQSQNQSQSPAQIDYNRDIRPILANHCWNCHGRDEASRKAELRLDSREAALNAAPNSQPAIVPGNLAASQLVQRIEHSDPELIMPPPETQKPLTPHQIQILKNWIAAGAPYAEHWAFIPPARPAVPAPHNTHAPNSPLLPIDAFILHRLAQHKLSLSPPAPPLIWLRRASLDTRGLPPSPDEVAAFLEDISQNSLSAARENAVDAFLASPASAERLAAHWLDLARYADTNGYNNDETRTMWPWRDWVINAFLNNMPYNQFLTEQLAGDLLPNPTLSQKVATGFNRNHVLTTEGGIIEAEYHAEYVADRIHTTSTVFLALSIQCARCHDHKYDPISQQDFYQLAAFFNNVPDRIVSYSAGRMAEPLLKVPSPQQQAELDRLTQLENSLNSQLEQQRLAAPATAAAWEASIKPEEISKLGLPGLAAAFSLDETNDSFLESVSATPAGIRHNAIPSVPGRFSNAALFDGTSWISADSVGDFDSSQSFSVSVWVRPLSGNASTVFSRMDDAADYRGYDLILESDKPAAHFVHQWPAKAFKVVAEKPLQLGKWQHILLTYDGSKRASGVNIFVDGVPQKLTPTTDNTLDGSLRTDKPFHIGRRHNSAPYRGDIDELRIFHGALPEADAKRLAEGQSTTGLRELLAIPAKQRSPQQLQAVHHFFLQNIDPVAKQLHAELAAIPPKRAEIEKQIPLTMVMQELPERRPTHILIRGQYDQLGPQVAAAIPTVFNRLAASQGNPEQNTPKPDPNASAPLHATRLDLANWLTHPKHPLTSRVAVNRAWELLFGTGIVETSEDFGIQGAQPSHPELLDWLAVELVESNWNYRALLKSILLSQTYSQSSQTSPQLRELDPRNTLLAHAPRLRLPAEFIRDSALAASGLLAEHVGGPSVKPWQPDGLWEDVSVERREKYATDPGPNARRRSLYTFWKRTCPPPGMTTFDAPDRETCVIRRSRTNTPLQALVLLNDPTYLAAAHHLAQTLLTLPSDHQRWQLAFTRVLTRPPTPAEINALSSVLNSARKHFTTNPNAALELLTAATIATPEPNTNATPTPHPDPTELAAWTTTLSTLLNSDEAITRP